jgi:hypothetical protein
LFYIGMLSILLGISEVFPHQEMDLIPGGGPNSIGASPRNNFHTVSILVNEKSHGVETSQPGLFIIA